MRDEQIQELVTALERIAVALENIEVNLRLARAGQ